MEKSSSSSQVTTHIVQKAMDEMVIIKEAEVIRSIPKQNFSINYNYTEETKKDKDNDKEKESEETQTQNIMESISDKKANSPKKLESSEKKDEKEKEKESFDYEIDILSDTSSLKKNNSMINNNIKNENSNLENIDNVIDVSEDKNSLDSKEEDKEKNSYSIENHRNKYISGYYPFNFFEKEKCKNINFKEINFRDYVNSLSSLWKKMSDKEKEPYIKLSEEFKKNLINKNQSLSSISQDSDEQEMLSKKRKRRRRRRRFERINSNIINDDEIKENKPLNNQTNSIGIGEYSTTVYTTNRYSKKKMLESNYYIREKSVVSSDEKEINRIINRKKDNNILYERNNKNKENEINSKKEEKKMILVDGNSLDKLNEYLNNTLIPFVVKSFDFLKKLSLEKSN
jgi:hypothetical protein